MCLRTVDNKIQFAGYEEGWKIFKKTGNGLIVKPQYRDTAFVRKVSADIKRGGTYIRTLPVGVWIEDRNDDMIYPAWGDIPYTSGFHIYIAPKHKAEVDVEWNDALHRVFFKRVVASGIQNQMHVVLAREMFICPEGAEWEDNLPDYMK